MDQLKYDLLVQINGRLEADMIKSYLEAQGIRVELFQEAVGHNIYPVTIDGLGRVQIFVPQEQKAEADAILEQYNQSKGAK